MIEWFKRNEQSLKSISIFIGIVIPLVSLSFSGIKYIDANQRLANQKTFENFHEIIGRVGGGEKHDIFVSAANIYELRNYPEYRDFSIRMLEDMQKNWAEGYTDVLAKEINLTKAYLESLD